MAYITKSIVKSLAAAAIAAATTFATPAFADQGDQPSVSIDLNGFDLSTEAGQEYASRMIHEAAGKVCGQNTNRKSLRETMEINKCMENAVAVAQTRLAERTSAKTDKQFVSADHMDHALVKGPNEN
ncbi:UrcA family protein [Novosphingobium sp. ZN18A2]|uniref:UrcA family protein n=1 Tax=Novosphingobium sp. ZN18A2 TaxID=3079861 RepID=UPI0030CEF4BA